jgi:hypothetical protein
MERYQPGAALPVELDPAELRRNLNRYAGNQSALQTYVGSLRERFEVSVGMKVIEQKIRETHVKKELLDTAYEMLKSAGRLYRLPQEEAVEQQRLRTQLLEEANKQGQLEEEITRRKKVGGLQTKFEQEDLKKKITDLKRDPSAPPKPPKQPSKVKRTAQEIKEQRELDTLRMEQLKEKLANYRQMTYAHEWQDEIAWKKNLRVNEPDDAESMILIYDQFKADLLKSPG